MSQVSIEDLFAHPLVEGDAEVHLDPATVERYGRALDRIEAVVVFRTAEGLLLADGYHRVAAARRAGRTTIEAKIRTGTRADALRYAASVGARQRGISHAKALEAIRRRSGSRWRKRDRAR